MKEVEFRELKVDDRFIFENTEYIKTADKKVSCCKVLNAINTNDNNQAVSIKPLTKVQIND